MRLIQNHIYFVEAPHKAGFPYCHCLLIDDDVKVLIDTSCGRRQAAELALSGIDVVLNSHFHEDHILHNNLFADAQVWVHALDAPAVMDRKAFLDYYGFVDGEDRVIGQKFIDSIELQPSPVHHMLKDGEVLDFGQVQLRVIHTPGHTPGHCAFYQEKTGLLFAGDIDLSRFGPWYAHDCSSIEDFIASIRLCMGIQPQQVISSHKGVFDDDIQQRLQNYLDMIFIKEAYIFEALQEPHTEDELVKKQLYYGPQAAMNEFLYFFEKVAVRKHLERLLAQNRIIQEGPLFYQAGRV